jgi:S1-C subfamily serine protease
VTENGSASASSSSFVIAPSSRVAIFLGVVLSLVARELVASGPVGGTAEERIAAIAKATPTATLIFEPNGQGGGSGVMISPEGEALTNFHVTSPCGSFMRCGMADGKLYDAVIVGIDPVGDLALIRVLKETPFPFSVLGDSQRVRVGDPCFAAGNPFLTATNLEPSVSWGIVSGVHRYQFPAGTLLEYGDCLQTDAAINPGNSGGALFDAKGDVIGIVGRCSFEKRQRINVGVGYAISSNQAENFLGVLRSGRIVDHATLGATAAADGSRVYVSNILDDSDAYRRGLRFGDQLVSLDNRGIKSPNDLTNILCTLPEGWRVPLVYRREGTKFETLVRLKGVHAPGELVKKMAGALPPSEDRQPKKPKKDKKEPKRADGPDEIEERELEKSVNKGGDFPPALQRMFEERKGMANDYFNRLGRERIARQLHDSIAAASSGKISVHGNPQVGWRIIGRVNGPVEAPVELQVGPHRAKLNVGEAFQGDFATAELFEQINRRSLAGMAAAVSIWRTIVQEGLGGVGEAVYFGSAPLRGQRPLHDCLQITLGEFAATLYVSPSTQRLEGIEVWGDADRDPVELYLIEGDDDSGKIEQMELVYGMDSVVKFRVDQFGLDEQGSLQ